MKKTALITGASRGIGAATAAINITVIATYDSQGNSRKEMRDLFGK